MNIEPEYRNGYLVTSEIKKVWSVQLDLAKQLLDVCKRHDLKIWADSGTLLGLVRHRGYIPWDDDMDFIMMREDYDKLLQCSDEFDHPYFLQSVWNEHGYSRGHAQLRDSTTTAILNMDVWQNFNQGIFIDIFVLDNMPDNQEEWIAPLSEVKKRMDEMHLRTCGTYDIRGGLKRSIPRWIKLNKSIKFFDNNPLRDYFRATEDLLRNIPRGKEGKLIDAMFNPNPDAHLRLREWFDDTVWLPFEDIMLPSPANYDAELRSLYGDNYMTPRQLPTMHGSVTFDTERPYTEVLPELRARASLKSKLYGWLKPPVCS